MRRQAEGEPVHLTGLGGKFLDEGVELTRQLALAAAGAEANGLSREVVGNSHQAALAHLGDAAADRNQLFLQIDDLGDRLFRVEADEAAYTGFQILEGEVAAVGGALVFKALSVSREALGVFMFCAASLIPRSPAIDQRLFHFGACS